MNICFVGFGNIAQAIIEGLLKSGISAEKIICIERNQQKIENDSIRRFSLREF